MAKRHSERNYPIYRVDPNGPLMSERNYLGRTNFWDFNDWWKGPAGYMARLKDDRIVRITGHAYRALVKFRSTRET